LSSPQSHIISGGRFIEAGETENDHEVKFVSGRTKPALNSNLEPLIAFAVLKNHKKPEVAK